MVIFLAVVLAVVSAIAVPLSLSRQLRDISALEQSNQEQAIRQAGEHGERRDLEELRKSRITL